jgi:hypothetical protein
MTRHRFVLQGEHRFIVVYGYEPAGIGYFLSVVTAGKRIVDYDATQPGYDGLPGLISALEVAGVVSTDAVHAALDALVETDIADIESDIVRSVAEMVSNLKGDAGE